MLIQNKAKVPSSTRTGSTFLDGFAATSKISKWKTGFLSYLPSNWQHSFWESAGTKEEQHGGQGGTGAQGILCFGMNPIGMDPGRSDQHGVAESSRTDTHHLPQPYRNTFVELEPVIWWAKHAADLPVPWNKCLQMGLLCPLQMETNISSDCGLSSQLFPIMCHLCCVGLTPHVVDVWTDH